MKTYRCARCKQTFSDVRLMCEHMVAIHLGVLMSVSSLAPDELGEAEQEAMDYWDSEHDRRQGLAEARASEMGL